MSISPFCTDVLSHCTSILPPAYLCRHFKSLGYTEQFVTAAINIQIIPCDSEGAVPNLDSYLVWMLPHRAIPGWTSSITVTEICVVHSQGMISYMISDDGLTFGCTFTMWISVLIVILSVMLM